MYLRRTILFNVHHITSSLFRNIIIHYFFDIGAWHALDRWKAASSIIGKSWKVKVLESLESLQGLWKAGKPMECQNGKPLEKTE